MPLPPSPTVTTSIPAPSRPVSKTRPNPIRPRPLVGTCAAIAVVAGLAISALAQPPSPSAAPTQSIPAPAIRTFTPPEPTWIDVDFPGGTVAEYCELVRRAAGSVPINIVMNEGVEDVPLPRMSFKHVSIDTAMKAVTMTGRPGNLAPVLMERLSDSPGSVAYFLQATGTAGRPASLAPRFTRVHSLRSIVEPPPGIPNTDDVAIPVDTLMSALTAAVQVDDNKRDPLPDLMLHRESLVLVCRGTDSQQDLIKSVLKELESDVGPRRIALANQTASNEKERLEKITMEAEMRQAALQLDRCNAEYNAVMKRTEELQKLFDSGQLSRLELERALADASVAKVNVDSAKSNLEMLRSRAAVLDERRAAIKAPDRRLIIYNVQDLAPFAPDISTLIEAIVGDGGKSEPVKGSLVITATPDQHRQVKDLLLTLRRVRANDPKLAPPEEIEAPGLQPAPAR